MQDARCRAAHPRLFGSAAVGHKLWTTPKQGLNVFPKSEIRNPNSTLLPLFFQPPQIATLSFLRRSAAGNSFGGCRKPLHPSQLDFLRSRWWCVIGVEFACTRLRDVGRLELENLDDAVAAARNPDSNRVPGSDGPVWFAAIAIDFDPAALARGLRLRTCFEDTRDIEPDIETY